MRCDVPMCGTVGDLIHKYTSKSSEITLLVSFRYTNANANDTTVQVPVFLSYCFCFSVFGRSYDTIAVPTFNTRECFLI